MPPRTRKSAQDKALEAALAHAATLLGDDFKLPTVEDVKSDSQVQVQRKEQHSLAFEGMLLSQHHKHPLALKQCKRCGLSFQTNYCYVAYCSDLCRKKQWEKDHGVSWDSIVPAPSYWEYEEPFVIPPDFVDKLYYYSVEFVRQYEAGLIRVSPTETPEPEPLVVEEELPEPSDNETFQQTPPPESQAGNEKAQASPPDMPLDLELFDFSF